jgi:hypothetical protein
MDPVTDQLATACYRDSFTFNFNFTYKLLVGIFEGMGNMYSYPSSSRVVNGGDNLHSSIRLRGVQRLLCL